MNESKWICERCKREYDLENGEGWIRLVADQPSHSDGKLSPLEPYETVCYECSDELLAIVEKCDKQCQYCEVPILWGLSVMDCLKYQLKFDLLDLPERPEPPKGSVEEAKEILRIFSIGESRTERHEWQKNGY
jgi:DNA-directed RNA polymerase subunit RPC12/RpoP